MKKEAKDKNKEERLLKTAFELFTEKGIKDTSIQEIVDRASVAKGTFYLYFKDKYEIRDILIAKEESVYQLFLKGVKENNIPLKNPEVTLYMIIELVSSTCFNSILYNEPLPIEEFKPYLYETIRIMMGKWI